MTVRKLMCALLGMLAVGCMAWNGVAGEGSGMERKALGNGEVWVYDRNAVRLHAWQTGDAMADACFVLETPTGLVGLESPPFRADVAIWKDYVAGLGKPLTDVLLDAHPAGGRWFGDARSHATAGAKAAIEHGATGALARTLGTTFGEAFDADIPAIDAILRPGANTIGGIVFEIIDAGDGYDVAVPEAGIYYTHMLGADSHSLFADAGQMDEYLKRLEALAATGWPLVLSSHHAPETQADVAAKIAYVRRVRELARQSSGGEDFMARVEQEYPGLKGRNYLEMTAGNLFR